uniref:TLDc domain-containing protein n=1 Tax=Paramoeba aestuarina TaxID=180227 RepID=A0A7S4KI10_9EUKA
MDVVEKPLRSFYYPKIIGKSKLLPKIVMWDALYQSLPGGCCLRKPKILFQSNTDGYSFRSLIAHLKNQRNILFFFRAFDCKIIFGGFVSENIEVSKQIGNQRSFIFKCNDPEADEEEQPSTTRKKRARSNTTSAGARQNQPQNELSASKNEKSFPMELISSLISSSPKEKECRKGGRKGEEKKKKIGWTEKKRKGIPEIEFKAYSWSGNTRQFFTLDPKGGLSFGSAIWIDENLEEGKTAKCPTYGSPPLLPNAYFRLETLEIWHFVDHA